MWQVEFNDDGVWRVIEKFTTRADAYSRMLMLKLYNPGETFRIVPVE